MNATPERDKHRIRGYLPMTAHIPADGQGHLRPDGAQSARALERAAGYTAASSARGGGNPAIFIIGQRLERAQQEIRFAVQALTSTPPAELTAQTRGFLLGCTAGLHDALEAAITRLSEVASEDSGSNAPDHLPADSNSG